MMAAPLPASANQMQLNGMNQHEHAEDHDGSGCNQAMHPLAAEEWLATQILATLDPRTVCELALINKNFCSASKSNIVWDRLLPSASLLEPLLKECDDKPLHYYHSLSKKDLYDHLCRSITLGGGLKKFWLDQSTGGECFMISARALDIAWGASPEYWEWLPCRGAWFPEVAFLESVCWFDIKGKFRQLLRPGSYVVSFRMQLRCASSWRWSPIKLSLQNVTYTHPPIKSRAFFHRRFPISNPPLSSPPTPQADEPTANDADHSESDSSDVWVECDVGEFIVEENEDGPVEVEFSMREVEVLGWKRGFLLDGVLIRPSYVVHAHGRPTASMGSIYGYKDGDDEDMDGVEDGYDEDNGVNNHNNENLYGVEDDLEDEDVIDDENADNDDHESEEVDEANEEDSYFKHVVVCNANGLVVAGDGVPSFPAIIFEGDRAPTVCVVRDNEEASQEILGNQV